MRLTLSLAFVAASIIAAMPAAAQDDSAGDKVNALIVYGNDKCPEAKGDEITICARKPEAERYRIPQGLRETPSTKSESWNSKVLAYERMGKTGTLSCTPTGPGGWTGCSQKLIDQAYDEKKGAVDVQFGKLIDEERAKRMSTVDADAAATQSRVEQAEKDYDAREKAAAEKAEQQKAAPAPEPKPSGN